MATDGDPDRDAQNKAGPSLGTHAALGMQFAIAIVLFAFAGQWLDRRLGTSPLFILLGVLGGGAASFYSMYRKLMSQHADKPGDK